MPSLGTWLSVGKFLPSRTLQDQLTVWGELVNDHEDDHEDGNWSNVTFLFYKPTTPLGGPSRFPFDLREEKSDGEKSLKIHEGVSETLVKMKPTDIIFPVKINNTHESKDWIFLSVYSPSLTRYQGEIHVTTFECTPRREKTRHWETAFRSLFTGRTSYLLGLSGSQ